MGIGSWPRPRWLLQAIHERLEGRLSETEFETTGDDAVRLAVDAQLRAGADVIADGRAAAADNPVASARVAEDKLRAIVEAAEVVRRG